MTNKEVRAKALEALESRGWCQGNWSDMGGRCCMMGAVRVALQGNTGPLRDAVHLDLYDNIMSGLRDELGLYRREDVYGWNDTPGRTLDEVKAALRGPQ